MTTTQAIAIVVTIIAAMLFVSHDWLAGAVALAFVAAPAALLARHNRA